MGKKSFTIVRIPVCAHRYKAGGKSSKERNVDSIMLYVEPSLYVIQVVHVAHTHRNNYRCNENFLTGFGKTLPSFFFMNFSWVQCSCFPRAFVWSVDVVWFGECFLTCHVVYWVRRVRRVCGGGVSLSLCDCKAQLIDVWPHMVDSYRKSRPPGHWTIVDPT